MTGRNILLIMVAVFVGVLVGLSFKSTDPLPVPDYKIDSIGSCTSESLALIKPDRVTADYLRSLNELCYSQAYGQALLQDFQTRRLKFVQQTYYERVLLWMVVIITLSGVALAAIQLLTSFHLAKVSNDKSLESSEFTLQKDKIVLRSSVTGLFVLIGSFAFFYVFVHEIYVIKEVNTEMADFETQQGLTSEHMLSEPGRIVGPAAIGSITSPSASSPASATK